MILTSQILASQISIQKALFFIFYCLVIAYKKKPNFSKQWRSQHNPTYFINSGSSLSSLVGATLSPLFLARGQPDKLVLKEENMPPQSQNSSSLTVCLMLLPQVLWPPVGVGRREERINQSADSSVKLSCGTELAHTQPSNSATEQSEVGNISRSL